MAIYILTGFFIWFEVLQVHDKGWMYLGDASNIVDFASAIINVILVVKDDWFHDTLWGIQGQQLLCSMAAGLMWFKLFFWLRLFTPTAFFMNLIS